MGNYDQFMKSMSILAISKLDNKEVSVEPESAVDAVLVSAIEVLVKL